MSSNAAHLQMLQMAAAVTQCGGIFPPVPPITMANTTGVISNTNPKFTTSNNTPSTEPTSSSFPLGMETMPDTSTTVTTSSNDDRNTVPKSSTGQGETSDSNSRENMEKALMQLYEMGQGLNSFPSGVAQANPFLHPTMFSATGKCVVFALFNIRDNMQCIVARVSYK